MDGTVDFQPKNPIATFEDDYGDTKIIHRPKGRRLSVFTGGNTPALRLNRAVAILVGQRVKARRQSLQMTQKQLCLRAGLQNVNPKQYIHAIEAATRMQGVRMGTLFALAHALRCAPGDLLPTVDEACALADVGPGTVSALAVGGAA